MVRDWHRAAPPADRRAFTSADRPPIVMIPVSPLAQRVSIRPSSASGDFDQAELARASVAFVSRRDGTTHSVHPRLLKLVYRAARNFHAPFVWVVSGYRGESQTSRHGKGYAIDIVLPGVSDSRLASYLRHQGFVGVGHYVVSGFVHLDVRDRSYFWLDSSGPGQPSRRRVVAMGAVDDIDARARARGEGPVVEQHMSPEESDTEAAR